MNESLYVDEELTAIGAMMLNCQYYSTENDKTKSSLKRCSCQPVLNASKIQISNVDGK